MSEQTFFLFKQWIYAIFGFSFAVILLFGVFVFAQTVSVVDQSQKTDFTTAVLREAVASTTLADVSDVGVYQQTSYDLQRKILFELQQIDSLERTQQVILSKILMKI